MKERLAFYISRIKAGRLQQLAEETVWLYSYARHYWKQMVFYTLLGLSGTVTSLFTSLISRDMVDIITGHQVGEIVKTFVAYITFTIVNLLINQGVSYLTSKVSISVDNSIKSDIFNKILTTDMESIQKYHTGDLLVRWGSDASNISGGVLNWIPNLIVSVVKFVSTFALVCWHDPMFAFLAMAGAPISLIASRSSMRRMRKNNAKSAALNARMSGFNQETFANIQTIKSFDLINLYTEKLKKLQAEYLAMRLEFQKMNMAISVFLSLTGLAVSYSCYGFGIYRVWSGAISYGTMTMFLSLSGNLTGTLSQLISMIPSSLSITTSARRLMEILNMPQEDYSDADKAEQLKNENTDTGISVEIRDLSYGYKNGTQVFEKAEFFAAPHETVALVGPSGGGKTTMLRLILGLLKPQEGTSLLYGKDREKGMDISPSSRRLFSYVPQGNTMFYGTIAENMRNVRPDASDEEIIEALKRSCAWEFVEKLPDGINSLVGERGNGFSEGQSQRLSIARALLRRAPILLLDEATSALDVETERRVLKNIMKDDYPRTCIVTTHRPTVLSVCSRVYAIKDRRCVVLSSEEVESMYE